MDIQYIVMVFVTFLAPALNNDDVEMRYFHAQSKPEKNKWTRTPKALVGRSRKPTHPNPWPA
jgi:hypothetical protein